MKKIYIQKFKIYLFNKKLIDLFIKYININHLITIF